MSKKLTEEQKFDRKADRFAVRFVSKVADRIYNGQLAAYDGIEAAREIKALLISHFS
jgi:hypothetical protein